MTKNKNNNKPGAAAIEPAQGQPRAKLGRKEYEAELAKLHAELVAMQELDTWLNARGVSLVFAEMKDPVRTKIERYGLTRTIDPAHFFPTLDAAVAEFVQKARASWRRPEARS